VTIGLALCAAVAGDLDEAVAWCEETDRTLTRYGCGVMHPQFRSYYAQILLRRGSDGDEVFAAELLEHRG